MASSPGFGSHPRYQFMDLRPPKPCSDSLSLRLHPFSTGSTPERGTRGLTCGVLWDDGRRAADMHSPDHSTKGTPLASLGAANSPQTCGLRLLVGVGVQGLFHSPCGVLFTFPSRYSFPIGGQRYLALEGGPPSFPQDFACPVVLRVHATSTPARRLRDSHPLWWAFPDPSADSRPWLMCARRRRVALQPRTAPKGVLRFGLLPVRSPLLRESLLMSRPRGTEMFQFPRCPSRGLCIQPPIAGVATSWVAPFGFDWLIARLQLPSHVSPLSAPFFGLWPLGIHPTPFSAWLALSRSRKASSRCARLVQHDPASRYAILASISFASAKSK